MSKVLVLYHANCADGFCAAWVAWQFFGDKAEYVPVNYSEPPPDVTDREVYILDFSYKYPVMAELFEKAKLIVVLDHHKTAKDELAPFGWHTVIGNDDGVVLRSMDIVFDMEKSGGRLAWDYFFKGRAIPNLVYYTEDRDLWLWKLPGSREVNDAIASYPFDFEVWNRLDCESLESEGKTIRRFKKQMIDTAVKNAIKIDMAGYKVPSMNTTVLQSEIGEQLSKGNPFSATFFIRADGKKVWSLRSEETGVDVSQIAKSFGGGGHKHAAGFTE